MRRLDYTPDVLDGVAAVGLGLLAWGLWSIWPPLAPTVIGALLLGGVLWHAVKRTSGRGPFIG